MSPPADPHPSNPFQDTDPETLLGAVARLGGFGTWWMDLRSGVTHWSQELDGSQGSPWTRTCPNDQVLELFAPASREPLGRAIDACVAHGTPYDLEVQVLGEDGRPAWVRVIGVPTREAGGRVVGVQGAYQDIHRSKAAVEKHRALAERFRLTLDSLSDGFALIDRDWLVTYANPAALAMVKLTQAQVIGASFWDLFPQSRGTDFEDHYTRAMHEGVLQRFEALSVPLQKWFRVSAFPSEKGMAISFSDITAQRREHERLVEMNAELERRVRQRTAQLEAANSDLKAFSYSIAHDLRSPLGTIAGYAQALEESREQQLGERSAHYLRRIRAAAMKMDAMTDAILALFRVASAELRRRPVDLADLARECAGTLQAQAPQRRVRLQVAGTLPAVADPTLIALVMQNLLSNAWKYSSTREDAEVEVGSREGRGGGRHYFVRDNGIGFEQAQAARLFEPFARLHGPGFEGSGIGLATVHKIIARHGGQVWAESVPGQGSTFYFSLG
jgi:hypothetical protein